MFHGFNGRSGVSTGRLWGVSPGAEYLQDEEALPRPIPVGKMSLSYAFQGVYRSARTETHPFLEKMGATRIDLH